MKGLIALLMVLIALSSSALAHSGRTDSSGGHYDRSTGEYHYHHGYPAHQHTDGICPYDFDDRTGENSGSSSGGSSSGAAVVIVPTAAPTSTVEPVPTPSPIVPDETEDNVFGNAFTYFLTGLFFIPFVVFVLVCVVLLIAYPIFLVISGVRKLPYILLDDKKGCFTMLKKFFRFIALSFKILYKKVQIFLYDFRTAWYNTRSKRLKEEIMMMQGEIEKQETACTKESESIKKKEYSVQTEQAVENIDDLCSDRPKRAVTKGSTDRPRYQQMTLFTAPTRLPEGYAVDENGLPYKANKQYGWGREFNAFVTDGGKCYHRSKCKVLEGKKKRLVHRYKAMEKYKPCELCKPRTDVADWWKQ